MQESNPVLKPTTLTFFRYNLDIVLDNLEKPKINKVEDLVDNINLGMDMKFLAKELTEKSDEFFENIIKELSQNDNAKEFMMAYDKIIVESQDLASTKNNQESKELNLDEKKLILNKNDDYLKTMASIIYFQYLKGENRFNLLLNCKAFHHKKTNKIDTDEEIKASYEQSHNIFDSCFQNLFLKLENKYQIQLNNFSCELIDIYLKTIISNKEKYVYLLQILHIFKTEIDELSLCYINYKAMLLEFETGQLVDLDEISKEQQKFDYSQDIRNSHLIQSSFHYIIEEKLKHYKELFNSGFEDVSVSQQKLKDIDFQWRGSELALIEIIYLMIESGKLEYKYKGFNKKDKGITAAYEDIFDFLNFTKPYDVNKRIDEIRSRQYSVETKKGNIVKNHYLFNIHKLICDLLIREKKEVNTK